MTALLIISQYIVAFLQKGPNFQLAEALQGLVSIVAHANVTTTSTSVTRLLAHIVYVLSMNFTRPASLLRGIGCSWQLPPTQSGDELELVPENRSMLCGECLQMSPVMITAQVPAHQAEVLSHATDAELPPQQPHRQLDKQTCALLIHELLEPLASRGSYEQLVCQHTIRRLRSD